ncbi:MULTISPECIES: cytochrome C oxidase subunit IV family protein [unclassified Oleiphilus]|uniref:cytochrome C oxidase subunit IV family protein n=1 Tax=unclassified Oleiphilus TaxID=2631174 RepID=UPI0007C40A5A|nr:MULTISPECIES: cytochrome C oxidase subunit IV family protein [unclassified Oleiphilus]KZY30918.1 hypothetical protein A3729_10220 [Oleiphilus sp. HI0043]KZZ71034.1 hypothetical protein A3763_01195 [Oleiphilus sp. HI0128]
MNDIKRVTLVWGVLTLITILASLIGSSEQTGAWIVLGSILMLILKGQLVVDHFMGMREVIKQWRLIMSAYCIVIGAFVFLAYCLSIFL